MDEDKAEKRKRIEAELQSVNLELRIAQLTAEAEVAKHATKEVKKELRRQQSNRRGNLQGCGCILIVLGLLGVVLVLPIPFAVPLIFLGAVILIVGLFA